MSAKSVGQFLTKLVMSAKSVGQFLTELVMSRLKILEKFADPPARTCELLTLQSSACQLLRPWQ